MVRMMVLSSADGAFIGLLLIDWLYHSGTLEQARMLRPLPADPTYIEF
jgi:hypothetical protein